MLVWALVLLQPTGRQITIPTAVLGDGLTPDSAVAIGTTQVATTHSSLSLHAAEPPNGIQISWTGNTNTVMELAISGVCSVGSLTLRIDRGDGSTPQWHQLDFETQPIARFPYYFKSDGVLQAWLYSDQKVSAALTGLRFSEFKTNISQWILDWAGCDAGDSTETVVSKVRQALHDCSVLQPDTPLINRSRRHQFFTDFMKSKSVHGYCANFGIAQTLLLSKIGVPARPVSLATRTFAEGQDRFATHVLLEFFDPDLNRWVLSDPTFNIGFEDEIGNRIGLQEILSDQETKNPTWRVIQFDSTQVDREVSFQSIPIADFFWWATAPSINFWWATAPSIDQFPTPLGDAYTEAVGRIPPHLRDGIGVPSSTAIEDRARQYR